MQTVEQLEYRVNQLEEALYGVGSYIVSLEKGNVDKIKPLFLRKIKSLVEGGIIIEDHKEKLKISLRKDNS
jgi:hypothetical protein